MTMLSPSLTTKASPRNSNRVPSVAMIGLTRSRTMMTALISPMTAAHARATSPATAPLTPALIIMAANIPVNAATAAIERSKPPLINSTVSPMAMSPRMERALPMFTKLLGVKKWGERCQE